MKTRIFSLILTTIILFSVLISCNVKPDANIPADTIADIATTTQPSTDSTVDFTGVYENLLFDFYKHILTINYDPEVTTDMDGASGFREIVADLSEAKALNAIGYIIQDINADNVPELLLYKNDYEINGKDSGTMLLSAFTYSNDAPVLLFEGGSRNRYYLLNNNLIYNEGSSAGCTRFGTYTLPAGATDIVAKDFYFASVDEQDISKILFFYNNSGSFDKDESTTFDGSEDEFWQIQTDFSKEIKETEITTFEVFNAGSDDIKSSPVYAVFAKDTLADLSNAERYTADNSGDETEVVFFAESEVFDFNFCSVELIYDQDSDKNNVKMTSLYSLDTVTSTNPLVVTLTFYGDSPAYGIYYTDSEEKVHKCTLTLSGEDNSLILTEV